MIFRKRITPAILTAFLGFGLYWVMKPEPGALSLQAGELYVVDGDTIRVGGDSVRLIGFNTPEIRSANCPEEHASGVAARDRLTSLLQEARDIRLLLEVRQDGLPRRDKYRRLLGRLMIDGQDAGTLLIAQGYAEIYGGGQRQDWCAILTGT